MSLVNDMLKDLEERRRQHGVEQRPDLEGVVSVPSPRRNNRFLWAALIGLLLSPLAGGYWLVQQKPSAATAPAIVQAAETAELSAPAPELFIAAETVSVATESAPIAPPLPSAIQNQPVAQQPSERAAADKAPKPMPTQALEKNQPSVHVAEATAQPTPSNTQPEPAALAAIMDKTPRELPPRAQADAALHQAGESLRGNRLAEAENHLRRALTYDNAHLAAREQLTGLLLHQGRVSEGAALLKQNLELHPRHLPFRQGHARLLIEQGSLEEARQLLLSGPPPDTLDPQFHGLLAALEQRLGNHRAAADLYSRLASAWPQRSAWWLGLGISLEATDRRQEAAAAFTGALRSKDLSGDLRRFADQRLASLQP